MFGLSACHPSELPEGPLADARAKPSSSSGVIDRGSPDSFGLTLLRNSSTTPVVVDSVRLEQITSNLRVLGMYLATQKDAPGVGIMPGFPPQDHLGIPRVAVQGARIPAGGSDFLVIGLTLPADGTGSFVRVVVFYHRGNSRFAAIFRESVKLCAPITQWQGRCEGLPIPD
jgi:hypothetical protein